MMIVTESRWFQFTLRDGGWFVKRSLANLRVLKGLRTVRYTNP
jgi:hypothetical protein